MCWVSQHVNVEELGHVPTPPHVVVFPERVPDVGTLFVHHLTLLLGSSGRSDLYKEHKHQHDALGWPDFGACLTFFPIVHIKSEVMNPWK